MLLALFSAQSPRSPNSYSQNYCISYHYFNSVMGLPSHEVSSNAATLHTQVLTREEGEVMNPGGWEQICM